MEVEAALRRHVMTDSTVAGLVGSWVWRHRLMEKVDGTGKRAIVIDRNNGWATPDAVTSQEYPIARLKLYADTTRTGDGEVAKLDAGDKAWAIYRAVDPLLHAKRDRWWGAVGSDPGLHVITSRRAGEPVLVTEKDRHGETAGDPLGDTAYVLVEYALQVVHYRAAVSP